MLAKYLLVNDQKQACACVCVCGPRLVLLSIDLQALGLSGLPQTSPDSAGSELSLGGLQKELNGACQPNPLLASTAVIPGVPTPTTPPPPPLDYTSPLAPPSPPPSLPPGSVLCSLKAPILRNPFTVFALAPWSTLPHE